VSDPTTRREARTRVLQACGAPEALLPVLLAYNEEPFERRAGAGAAALPLADEPHLEAWQDYAARAEEIGVLAALRERFVQLRFPIRAGISQEPSYRAATLRGQLPGPFERGPELELVAPEALELRLNSTPAGRIPTLTAGPREDFVALVRAFSERNEPAPVPDAMGACIVNGLNNWDRIERHRRRWQEELEARGEEGDWSAEFKRLAARKELYQDRFIILSSGPYSSVGAGDAGFDEGEWLRLSRQIRREHESTHYFMYRVLGSMKNNLLDELVCDLVGLARALGEYDAELALLFFGLERFPEYRRGGRLESYCGTPPLPEPAVAVLRALVYRAIRNLEAFTTGRSISAWDEGLTPLVLALGELTLEEIASEHAGRRLEELLAATPPALAAPVSVAAATSAGAPPPALWANVETSAEGLRGLLEAFDGFAAAQPRVARVRTDLALALDEVVSNVVNHGFEGEPDHVILAGFTVKGSYLEVELIDEGRAFNPLDAPVPELHKALAERPIGGLGIHLVKELMDKVDYRLYAGRNHLILRKRLP